MYSICIDSATSIGTCNVLYHVALQTAYVHMYICSMINLCYSVNVCYS